MEKRVADLFSFIVRPKQNFQVSARQESAVAPLTVVLLSLGQTHSPVCIPISTFTIRDDDETQRAAAFL